MAFPEDPFLTRRPAGPWTNHHGTVSVAATAFWQIVNENQTRGVADEVLKENEKELVGVAGQNARERLKGNFILGRIAEKETITVSQDDLKGRLFQMAMRYQMTMDKLIKEVQKNNLMDQIREEILIGKVLDFLSSNASVQTAEQPA